MSLEEVAKRKFPVATSISKDGNPGKRKKKSTSTHMLGTLARRTRRV